MAHPLSRRQFARTAALAVPGLAVLNPAQLLGASGPWNEASGAFANVTIGAITYSFRSIAKVEDIIAAYQQIGLTSCELMSNHCEALAGAPQIGRGMDREPLVTWRADALQNPDKVFGPAKKAFNDAGVDVRFLTYNMSRNTTPEEMEYAFAMAKALKVKAITTSTQVSVAEKIAPFADKHKTIVAYHGHDSENPDEFAKPESFAKAMAMSKYHRVNLDIGHFTAAGYDPVAYIKEHHARITNLHLKDRKKDHGANLPWGEGDTPIRDVLLLLKKEGWDIPANVEFEYRGDAIAEVTKCFQFCRDVLK